MCDLIAHIQAKFAASWLLHPNCGDLPKADLPFSSISLQQHPQRFELCCVLEGTVLLQVEQDACQMQQGQVFLLPPGTLHSEFSVPGCTGTSCWFVCFHDRIWVNICAADETGTLQLLHGQQIAADPIAASLLLKDITNELSGEGYGSDALLRCSVLQLLVMLTRKLKDAKQSQSAQQWQESVTKEVLAHLRSNPGVSPDLSALADRYAMSTNHLNTIFKTVTGKTINAYCADLRIEQAKYLLGSNRMKLWEISEQLGYYDQYHFCKAFKKATGKSPSAYRAERNG